MKTARTVTPLPGELDLDDIIREPPKPLRPLLLATRDDVFIEGASHVFAANPKGGKSTLLEFLGYQWALNGHKVLYLSEEFKLVWQHRTHFLGLEANGGHFKFVQALGEDTSGLLRRAVTGKEDIVILDTIRTLLGVKNLSNSDEVVEALKPWLNGVTKQGKTLILAHHFTKTHEIVAGGVGLLAAVDTVIKYRQPEYDKALRIVETSSRLPLAGDDFGLRMTRGGSDAANFVVEAAPGELSLSRDEALLYGVLHTEAEVKAAEAAGDENVRARTVVDLMKATGWPESKTKYILKQLLGRELAADVTGNAGVGGRGHAAAYVRTEEEEQDEDSVA